MIVEPPSPTRHKLGNGIETDGRTLCRPEMETEGFLKGHTLLGIVVIQPGAVYVCDACGESWVGVAEGRDMPATRSLRRESRGERRRRQRTNSAT